MKRTTLVVCRTVLLVACLFGSAPGRSSTLEYQLELPSDRTFGYEIEFEVIHPGPFRLEADWSPSRVLVFRLNRPGARTLRRSGPSPQRLEIDVSEDDLDRGAPWTLSINGLPSRRAGRGRVVIELPDSPDQRRKQEPDPPAPVPELDPWTVSVNAPPGLRPARRRVFETTERFRELVVDSGAPDAYRWQDGMLRFLADRRDTAATTNAFVESATRPLLRRVVNVVRDLDQLRRSGGVPVSRPTPSDAVRRRALRTVRDPRFVPVADELDALLDDLQSGHAPELRDREWPVRFLSCLILCERHFEERARLGAELASNGELVEQQWSRVLAAADALEALVRRP